jgi:hypothetical protein
VKAALVVGFYSPVEEALNTRFEAEVRDGSLASFSRVSSHQAFDFNAFKSTLFQKLDGDACEEIVIVAADFTRARGFEWLSSRLGEVIAAANSRSAGSKKIGCVECGDTQNPAPVFQALQNFGFPGTPEAGTLLEERIVRTFRGSNKILCVRGADQTPYEEALKRGGIQFQDFNEHFMEVVLRYGSNVGNTVKKLAKHHSCLIYANGVLKYIQPPVKAKWKHFFEGRTPSDAVGWFRQALSRLAQDEKALKSDLKE